MQQVSKRVTATILSISLLTVMAGAAIAPALGIIKEHFAGAPAILIQLIVSIPALFIIITNLCFPALSRRLSTRTIASLGLALYVLAGAGCFFILSIGLLLVMRALLGVSVGMLMPLSTGLLSFYYPPEAQAKLMGLSAAMNQLGGVVATLLAGILATVEWNFAFLVYLLGLIAMVLVLLYLPAEHLQQEGKGFSLGLLRRFHPSVVGMLLLMLIFFIYPTNFAVTAHQQAHLSVGTVTLIMVWLDFVAAIAGMLFGKAMRIFRHTIKYFAAVCFLAAYAMISIGNSAWLLVVASTLGGVAMGVGVPYLNTIASIKGGKNSATSVMPLISASLYLGQFISPIIVTPVSHLLFGADNLAGPYVTGCLVCLGYMVQVYTTRHFQSLPPENSLE